MTEYLSCPPVELPDFQFDNIYVTENILIFGGAGLPTERGSRNTLTFNGNLRANHEIKIVPQNFADFGPNDLFFNGNIYVAGDVMAEIFETYVGKE